MDALLTVIIGLLAGAVVNALADALPDGPWLRRPRYADGSPRPVIAWLGVADWLARPGRADTRRPRLPWRYPATELTVASLLLATHHFAAQNARPPGAQLFVWQAYAVAFVLLALVDLQRKRILLAPLIAAALLALFDAVALPQPPPNLASALFGGACGGLVFGFAYLGGQLYGRLAARVRSPAFGAGDVYLMALSGLIVGFPHILVAMILTIVLGGIGALIYLTQLRLRGRRYRRFTALPYAPYILAATYALLLFPDEFSRAAVGIFG